jgi:glycosyltransferase involved in cell wall biosynthesis
LDADHEVIAGAGDDMGKYEAMMVHPDRFTVISRHISYAEGAELFQRCSVVALPYVEASQSGVVSTAYGFGKPVVVTAVGAIAEIVEDGVTGLVVPPRDPARLAAAIVRLLKDPAMRTAMGKRGNGRLSGDLSWDRVVGQTAGVYRKAAGIRGDMAAQHPAEIHIPVPGKGIK